MRKEDKSRTETEDGGSRFPEQRPICTQEGENDGGVAEGAGGRGDSRK